MRLGLILLMVCSTAARAVSGETVTLRGAAQGTTWHVKFVAPAAKVDERKLQEEIERELATIDRQMSTYRADSEISRFNRATAGEWFAVSRAVAEVVEASRAVSEKTGGAQDVTVGPLVRLWKFGPRDASDKGNKTLSPQPSPKGRGSEFKPPTDEEIRAARGRVGYKKLDVRLEPPALRKQVEGLAVDLSSIAPGYTVDRLAKVLQKRGIDRLMVELGGEVRAAGTRADGTPWRVAIERPGIGTPELATAVPLVDAAMATAGGSLHFFEYQGRRYSHIIDPATGRPVERVLSSVTVAAETCMDADVWDTPLVVLGLERGLECAEKNGVAALFIRNETKGDEVRTTSTWRKRFGEK
jgi:thiamine biosynthesis lipoprotein